MDVNAIPSSALPLVNPQLPGNPGARRQDANNPIQAKKVAQEFEAMFVGMMLKSMRETVGKEKLTGGGHGEETFRSLLDQEYATAATRNGGVGLASMIEKELTHSATPASKSLKGHSDAD
jgi:peptidoglycan hydrolase FlgJ